MKSFLIIGTGRFGKHLSTKLVELGNDVVAVDKSTEKIEQLNNILTDSFVGDCRNEAVLKALGVNNFDVCFVCIAEDFQSSLEITAMLKELKASYVVSISKTDRHAELLKKIGADDVIYPEKQIAEKTGIRYNAKNIVDLIQISDEYAIYEIPVSKAWVGKTIIDVNVRKNYKVNIIAIKNNDSINAAPGADYTFRPDDHIMIIGKQSDVFKLTEKN
jgi:trk system potassium uptake protein TrkA